MSLLDDLPDKFESVVELGVKIMGVDVEREANLLDLNDMLILSGFLFSLCLLKAIFAVVHDLADRRLRLRSNLYQIKILLFSDMQRVPGGHYSELLAVRADNSQLFVTNFLINLSILFFLADD